MRWHCRYTTPSQPRQLTLTYACMHLYLDRDLGILHQMILWEMDVRVLLDLPCSQLPLLSSQSTFTHIYILAETRLNIAELDATTICRLWERDSKKNRMEIICSPSYIYNGYPSCAKRGLLHHSPDLVERLSCGVPETT